VVVEVGFGETLETVRIAGDGFIGMKEDFTSSSPHTQPTGKARRNSPRYWRDSRRYFN
jgi:hypothetical protein